MTWCQQEQATVEEMTCQPTDLPNDFWLSAQREMFHLSLSAYGMKDQRPGQQFLPSLNLQKLRGGKQLRLTNRFLVAFD